jgi:hypothetical protein
VPISPRFWTSEDVKKELADREAAVKRRKPYLEQVVLVAPESAEAKAARELLAEFR